MPVSAYCSLDGPAVSTACLASFLRLTRALPNCTCGNRISWTAWHSEGQGFESPRLHHEGNEQGRCLNFQAPSLLSVSAGCPALDHADLQTTALNPGGGADLESPCSLQHFGLSGQQHEVPGSRARQLSRELLQQPTGGAFITKPAAPGQVAEQQTALAGQVLQRSRLKCVSRPELYLCVTGGLKVAGSGRGRLG